MNLAICSHTCKFRESNRCRYRIFLIRPWCSAAVWKTLL